MSNIFVDADGFIKKTYADHKEYYETKFKGIFGNDIDLDITGPIGQMVAVLSKRDADIWDGAEEIYNSRNPNSATGISLDNISAETGVIRQAAGKTAIYNVFLTGSLSTTIPAGSLVRQSGNDINFELLTSVTISLTTIRKIILSVDAPGGAGETYSIVIDGITYSYDSLVTDDENDIATELKDLIDAGTFGGVVSRTDNILTITQLATDFTETNTSNIQLEEISSGGDFECVITGNYPVPSQSLNTIVTPITGWDSVINEGAGITGRNVELDSELRIRRESTLLVGNATDEAIRSGVLNDVSGVSSVAILSNRTDVVDADGLDPHSFEVVVVGGLDDDIAETIWLKQPSGIKSFGNTNVVVVDSQGNDQSINFSRPTPLYIWVKVKRDLYSEEDYPANGDNLIKAAIISWAALNQPVGKDVIRQRLNIPVYSVPGIGDVVIELDSTALPTDTPTYAEQDISILIREYADFALTRISIEDLTP